MSAAESEPADVPDHMDPWAVELANRLVDLFGIERARRITWQAASYLREKYGDNR